MEEQRWKMTTHLTCLSGHHITVIWTLPHALVQTENTMGLTVSVSAKRCQITYENAYFEDGCLKCLECGSDVPSPTVEALTRAECPEVETHEQPNLG